MTPAVHQGDEREALRFPPAPPASAPLLSRYAAIRGAVEVRPPVPAVTSVLTVPPMPEWRKRLTARDETGEILR